jgi:hypothetical protein
VPPGIGFSTLVTMVVMPFLIMSSGNYTHNARARFYNFYNIPAIKFISSTICCILRKSHNVTRFGFDKYLDMAFLILLSINVLGSDPVGYEIRYFEYLLWAWIFASALEEVSQYSQDPSMLFSI